MKERRYRFDFQPGDRVKTDSRLGSLCRRGEVVEMVEMVDSRGRRLRAYMVRFRGSSRAEKILGHRLLPEDAELDI